MSKQRKMISFNLENFSEKEQSLINAWADGQKNIRQSLSSLVHHAVRLVGNEDVMDFEVQNKLHRVSIVVESEQQAEAPPIKAVEKVKEIEENDSPISKASALFDEN